MSVSLSRSTDRKVAAASNSPRVKKDEEPAPVPMEFKLESFLPHTLITASNTVSKLMLRNYLKPTGLSIAEWEVLATIGRHGKMTPTVVSGWTGHDKVKVSRSVNALSGRGLVKMADSREDGRSKIVDLTKKGRDLAASVQWTAADVENTLRSGLSASDWNALQRGLLKLSNRARELTTEAADE